MGGHGRAEIPAGSMRQHAACACLPLGSAAMQRRLQLPLNRLLALVGPTDANHGFNAACTGGSTPRLADPEFGHA